MEKIGFNKKIVLIALAASVLPVSAMDNGSEAEAENLKVTGGLLSDSSRVYDIDEVVVVSMPKENARLRHQPISSTSFGTYQMQRLGVRDFRELSSYVPNFVMPNYGSRLSSAMYVRGIGSRVNSPAVGMYLDGMPLMSKAALNLHHYQLSRIDVLRGPQGTLYGQNSEGGLVRLFSRDAFDHQGTYLTLSLGSHFYRNVEAAHYQQFSPKIALSVAGFYNGSNGLIHRAGSSDYADDYQEAGGKFNLKFRLNKGWNVDVLADYQWIYQNAFPYGKLDLETGKADNPSTTFPGYYQRNVLISGINVHHQGEWWQFGATTSYQYLNDHMRMDQDYLPADYLSLQQDQLQNALTQELTWKTKRPLFGFWHLTQGAFFSQTWLKTNGPVGFGNAITDPIARAIEAAMRKAMHNMVDVSMDVSMAAPGLFHTPQTNFGIYHESVFDITPELSATLGLRYDFMHTAIHYDTYAFMAIAARVMGMEKTSTLTSKFDHKTSDDYNQLLPKFGFSYKIDQLGSNIYVTVAKGYRAGGYNIQMFSDILQTELNANSQKAQRSDYEVPHTDEDYQKVNATIAYKPETSWNYEFGTHLNLFDNMLHFDLSGFYMQIRNQQLSVMSGHYGYGRMMVNAGKSHSCGIEAALKGQALNGQLDWAVNYGYTRAKFDEYVDGEGDASVSYKDKYVPYVPQHTMAAMIDYRFDRFTVGMNMNGQGKTYWDNANTYSQKMYFVLGAHIDGDFNWMKVSLWARNLTNTYYNTFAVDNAATGTKQYFAQRGNPFTCGVDITLHF